jgi:uncharacterized membrane protein YvbJ
MKCPVCGFENNDNSKFCNNCGAQIQNLAPKQHPQQMNTPLKPNNVKKPWYTKWWIWVIIVVLVCGIIGAVFGKSEEDENKSTTAATTSTPKATKKETQSTAKTIKKKTNKQIKKEFKASCKTITYKKLARNPDKYKGKNYKITGQVIQVLESDSWFSDTTTLRINMTATKNQFADGGVLWSDTIISAVDIPEGADKILEDDIITLWGTCEGSYQYEAITGQKITAPRIDIKYYTIK